MNGERSFTVAARIGAGGRLGAAVLLACFLWAQDKAIEKCSVSGTVVDSLTGASLAKVEVRMEPTTKRDGRLFPATVTDSKGNFSLAGIDADAYYLKAERLGYLSTSYGAKREDGRGTILQLQPGTTMTGLTVSMFPGAVVSGTVREADGDPAVGIGVVLSNRTYRDGHLRKSYFRSAWTDDLGQYRFSNLPSGRYDVEAREVLGGGHPVVDRSAEGTPPLTVRLPARYSGVQVTSGSRTPGVDLVMSRGRAVRVSGSVTYAPGVVGHADRVELQARGDVFTAPGSPDANGHFEFGAVSPGSYILSLRFGEYVAQSDVEVGERDVDGVRLLVEPAAEVTGQVSFEGEGQHPGGQYLLRFSGDRWDWAPPISADGTFSYRMPPDHYSVSYVRSPGENWFLKSARTESADLLEEGLIVAHPGKVNLDVRLSNNAGRVDGLASDEKGKPAAGATIVLVPENPLRRRFDLFQSTNADQNGYFEFSGVMPAEYRVLAWDSVESGIWYDADFLKKCESAGEKVGVHDKEKAHVAIKLIDGALVVER